MLIEFQNFDERHPWANFKRKYGKVSSRILLRLL